MFDQTFVDATARTNKPWTVGASLTLQAVGVGTLLLLPLLHPETLSFKREVSNPVMYRLTQPPLPKQLVVTRQRVAVRPAFVMPRPLTAQVSVPNRLIATPDLEAPAVVGYPLPGGTPGNSSDGLTFALTGPTQEIKPPVKPTPPIVKTPETPAGPLQVSTGVQASKLIYGPKPPYPPIAKASRTQGTVLIQAIIGEDGSIRNLKVVSGPGLLIKAALDAVSQWRYQPTLLSGKPVQVITEISLNFTLNGN